MAAEPPPGIEAGDLCRTGQALRLVYEATRREPVRPEEQRYWASARVAYHVYVCDYCRKGVGGAVTVFDHFAETWAEAGIASAFIPEELAR